MRRASGVPGNDLVSVWHDIIGAHENWLENALFPDRVDEGLQCIRSKCRRGWNSLLCRYSTGHAIVPLPIVGHRNRRALIAEQRGQTGPNVCVFLAPASGPVLPFTF